MNVTYEDVRNSEEIRTYIKQADESLKAIGYTEHSFAHCTKVAKVASGGPEVSRFRNPFLWGRIQPCRFAFFCLASFLWCHFLCFPM